MRIEGGRNCDRGLWDTLHAVAGLSDGGYYVRLFPPLPRCGGCDAVAGRVMVARASGPMKEISGHGYSGKTGVAVLD